MDLDRKKFTKNIAGEEFTIETSKIAGQTNGSVIATYGDTTILATVVMGTKDGDADYMPLYLEDEEQFYSVGKIHEGMFMRREGRPSEKAVLTDRMIDKK